MLSKKPFWKWVFCETDGTPSFARVSTAVTLAFVLGWITAIVRSSHAIPELGGPTMFLSALYGVNKFASAVQRNG